MPSSSLNCDLDDSRLREEMSSEVSGIHRDNDELAGGEEFSREISVAGNCDSLAEDDVPELK
jgi:hypothetical protein